MRRRRRRLFLLAGTLVLLVLAGALVQPVRVIQGSMRPALKAGDVCLAFRPARRPRRGQLVLLVEPDLENLVVKRVAGLPGEQVQILGDDVFVNGRRAVRRVAGIGDLVPLAELAGEAAGERFGLAGGHFVLDGGHWRLPAGTEGAAGMLEPASDGFLLADTYQPGPGLAEELGIEATFVLEDDTAAFEVEITEQGDRFWVRVEEGGRRISINRGAQLRVVLRTIHRDPPMRSGRVFLANVDQVLTAALDGQVVYQEDYGAADLRVAGEPPSDLHVTRAGVAGTGPLALDRIRLGRDLVRIPSGTHGCAEALHLGRDEYFVLGDDPHASRDSRQYGAVSRARLRGRLILRLWPPGPVGMGWGR